MVKELKCWKQLADLPYWTQYVDKGGKKQVNVIKLKKGYSLDIGKIPVGLISSKKYKTESQALKAAKSYMKKHNVCSLNR